MLKKVVLCICLFLMIFSGCKKSSLTPVDYVKWIEDTGNGLRIEKEIGDYTFILQYKPLDYIVAMEQKSKEIKSDILSKREKALQGMDYFTLRISYSDKQKKDVMASGITTEDEYFQRSNYYSEDFQDDISLLVGKDTIACGLFNNVRNYGLAPYMDFVIGFETKDYYAPAKDRLFILNDKVYGCGIIKFTISQSDIEKIPSLKTI